MSAYRRVGVRDIRDMHTKLSDDVSAVARAQAATPLRPHAPSPTRLSHGLRKISSETGSLTLAPGGTPLTLTRLFSANGLITMSGLDVGIA